MNVTIVEDAIELATRAHTGQVDKQGLSYIFHPLRVMLAMEPDDVDGQVVAVLHDVIEDTTMTLGDLFGLGYPTHVISALSALTHRHGEPYMEYVRRTCANALSRRVKLADVRDNIGRLDSLDDEVTRNRLEKKYRPAIAYLEAYEDS